VLAIGIVIIIVGTFMDRFLEPRLRGDAIVHPILTVVALMILGEAIGVLGMLIALPLAATLQIVLNELIHISVAPRTLAVSAETTQIEELRSRIEQLQNYMPEDDGHRREAEGMAARLKTLLERTEEVVRDRTNADRRRQRDISHHIPDVFSHRKAS
jgi:hypothetical protein